MEFDDFYDEMDMDMNEYGSYSEEELIHMLESHEQEYELTPDLAEILKAYRQKKGQVPFEYEQSGFGELYDNCIIPTWTQTTQTLLMLFILCIIFRVILQLWKLGAKSLGLTHWIVHIFSAVLGILALHSLFKMALVYVVICCALTYFIFIMVTRWNRDWCGVAGAVSVVVYTITCEVFLVEPATWHKIRGAQIILYMKIISLGIDIGKGAVPKLPNIVEYCGYCFNVGTVIFGPWVSYDQYTKILDSEVQSLSFLWAFKVLITSSFAMFCLIHSNCLTSWLVMGKAWRWILAYRDAQSFRFSHYSISFLSDATSTLSGIQFDGGSILQWNIARPQHIEIPRSLVEVVTNWNLPMHFWLKSYVFKMVRPYGTFAAIILTYAASSLLHGLNFQLAAVLLSLGFYSYTEFVLRVRLSKIFDACIQAKRCKEKCDHKYKSNNPLVLVTNLAFGALAIFHLAYLGLMFDSSDGEEKGYTMWHTLGKWSSLNFLSHWFALGTFIFYWLI